MVIKRLIMIFLIVAYFLYKKKKKYASYAYAIRGGGSFDV
jgi:hypothetical protein